MKEANVAAQEFAQEGLRHIQMAILMVLESHPEGLRNSQIADLLDLRSSIRGSQQDYLTYSVLGGLMERGKVAHNTETKVFTKIE